MKHFHKLFAVILVLCMVMSLWACGGAEGGSEDNSKDTSNVQQSTEATTTAPVEDDNKIVYKIIVKDAEGNGIASAMVQMCDEELCYAPTLTDANGVAEFNMVEGEYKAAMTSTPEGYVDIAGEYFYFEDGKTEVTITLEAK
ncbi:MAG: hypothetical protein E7266_01400 [Lachnospiraceae bacterium]|nr:hypothetical protein [Lachnospiraceae bacterium]